MNEITLAELSRMSGKPFKMIARKVVKYGIYIDGSYQFDKNKRIPFEMRDYWFELLLSEFDGDIIKVF